MNRVFVSACETPLPAWTGRLQNFTQKALDETGVSNWDLSVLLCGDKTIRGLNKQYRGADEATDVLSFELAAREPDEDGEARFLAGDIVISLETLRENARYFNIGEDEELRRLLVHGILHLYGLDHETNNDTEPMIAKQECILKRLKGEHILPDGELFSGALK